MKHRISLRKLSRDTQHRLAMLKTMVGHLIKHERIETTLAKAKELRRVADKVVTYGKKGSERSWELAAEYVRSPVERHKLFTEMAHRYQYRAGGYTRVIRSRVRQSDSAQLAYIEFVDRINELRPAKSPLKPILPKSDKDTTKSSTPDTATTEAKKKPDFRKKFPIESNPKWFFGLF